MNLRLIIALATLLLAGSALPAVADTPPAFEFRDADSRIILLGSIHILPGSDRQLPPIIEELVDTADRIVFELPANELDPQSVARIVMALGTIPGSGTLPDLIGSEDYQRLMELTSAADLPLAQLQRYEPWLLLIQYQALHLQRLGFTPDSGVEAQVKAMARARELPMAGLETARQQMKFFDDLPLDTQVAMLLQYLENIDSSASEMAELVEAWRQGDLDRLDQLVAQSFKEQPELNEIFLARRNRDWTRQLQELLEIPGTSLVVVGAAHLAGPDSLPVLLRADGLAVNRLD
ncbi:MAG: TraB/GumN family protein [Gammaproteobacteria bacterium]|nr:TraB/GumN family protein [Gammaproteobacteria bacterium]